MPGISQAEFGPVYEQLRSTLGHDEIMDATTAFAEQQLQQLQPPYRFPYYLFGSKLQAAVIKSCARPQVDLDQLLISETQTNASSVLEYSQCQ